MPPPATRHRTRAVRPVRPGEYRTSVFACRRHRKLHGTIVDLCVYPIIATAGELGKYGPVRDRRRGVRGTLTPATGGHRRPTRGHLARAVARPPLRWETYTFKGEIVTWAPPPRTISLPTRWQDSWQPAPALLAGCPRAWHLMEEYLHLWLPLGPLGPSQLGHQPAEARPNRPVPSDHGRLTRLVSRGTPDCRGMPWDSSTTRLGNWKRPCMHSAADTAEQIVEAKGECTAQKEQLAAVIDGMEARVDKLERGGTSSEPERAPALIIG